MNGAPSDIVDETGTVLGLGSFLGGGGEGSVWNIPTMPTMVAKVYHEPLTPDRAEKIRVMSGIGTAALSKLTAWPEKVLYRKTGSAIGLLIPKAIDAKDIHKLYSPKSRRAEFQRADWRFLVHTAANTARAFAAVHEAGHVIGDVNHGSVLVTQDATVRLVDCDSFQITTGGRCYLCDKGVETFTPPELQGKSLAGIVRKANHDNFGLAVLVFQLLFLGRHPFAGRFSGKGDMPISTAIKEIRFPYGSRAASIQMSRPPGTPPLSTAGREVEQLFERAFAKETVDSGRPAARDWIATLDALEKATKQCGVQKSHWYPVHLQSCPWCEMERATGATLFPFVFQPNVVGKGVDIHTLLRRIDAFNLPAESPPAAPLAVKASARALAETAPTPPELPPEVDKRGIVVAAVLGLLVLLAMLPKEAVLASIFVPAVAYFAMAASLQGKRDRKVQELIQPFQSKVSAYEETVDRYEASMKASRAEVDRALAEWRVKTDLPDLVARKDHLRSLKSEIDRIPEKRRKDLEKLEGQRRMIQMSRHLERYRVIDATIEGVGPGRKLTLEAYGVETADDVTTSNLAAVPGFGPKLTRNILAWRRSAEVRFVFDPSKGVDPTAIAAVEQAILALKSRLVGQVETQANELLRDLLKIMNARATLRTRIAASQNHLAQATADYQHVDAYLQKIRSTRTT